MEFRWGRLDMLVNGEQVILGFRFRKRQDFILILFEMGQRRWLYDMGDIVCGNLYITKNIYRYIDIQIYRYIEIQIYRYVEIYRYISKPKSAHSEPIILPLDQYVYILYLYRISPSDCSTSIFFPLTDNGVILILVFCALQFRIDSE